MRWAAWRAPRGSAAANFVVECRCERHSTTKFDHGPGPRFRLTNERPFAYGPRTGPPPPSHHHRAKGLANGHADRPRRRRRSLWPLRSLRQTAARPPIVPPERPPGICRCRRRSHRRHRHRRPCGGRRGNRCGYGLAARPHPEEQEGEGRRRPWICPAAVPRCKDQRAHRLLHRSAQADDEGARRDDRVRRDPVR